jgi:hypothetical protein
VQQGLTLFAPAGQIAARAIRSDLRDVPADRQPPLDLAFVVVAAAAQVIAAIPLEPSARIVAVDPALRLPNPKRLRCIDAEKVELWIMSLVA